MDDIDQRLKETSENCLKTFDAWKENRKDIPAKEALQEAIHELRKVASRLEIELATSERIEGKQKPLPIPPHRSKRRRDEEGEDGATDNAHPPKPKSKRPPRKERPESE